jgi:hypothetical protein
LCTALSGFLAWFHRRSPSGLHDERLAIFYECTLESGSPCRGSLAFDVGKGVQRGASGWYLWCCHAHRRSPQRENCRNTVAVRFLSADHSCCSRRVLQRALFHPRELSPELWPACTVLVRNASDVSDQRYASDQREAVRKLPLVSAVHPATQSAVHLLSLT